MRKELPPELVSLLRDAGLRASVIERCKLDSRIYHDLGIYGEIAEGVIAELRKRSVDLTKFEFEEYFPPEFYGDDLLRATVYHIFPFLSWWRRRRELYRPLFLRDLIDMLQKKRWEPKCR